jgi:hypothetical protein
MDWQEYREKATAATNAQTSLQRTLVAESAMQYVENPYTRRTNCRNRHEINSKSSTACARPPLPSNRPRRRSSKSQRPRKESWPVKIA